jgi:hypothetical protein
MGLLNKKEAKVERPVNICGKNNSFKWFTDKNDILLSFEGLMDYETFCSEYQIGEYPLSKITNEFGCDSLEIVKALYYASERQFPLFLVWAELPEMVENIVINQYKEIKRKQALLDEKIAAKRKKLQ